MSIKRETRKPKKIRKMSALAIAVMFTLAGMNIANADTGIIPTLDKIKTSETTYLNSSLTPYKLVSDGLHTTETNSIIINGTKYWFTPNAGDKDVVTLSNTGSVALKEVLSSENPVFYDGTKYYSYDVNKLPVSNYTISETTLGNQTFSIKDADGNTKYYTINLNPVESGKSYTLVETIKDATDISFVIPTEEGGKAQYFSIGLNKDNIGQSEHIKWNTTSYGADGWVDDKYNGSSDFDVPNKTQTTTLYYQYTTPEGYSSSERINDTLSTSDVNKKIFKDLSSTAGGAIYNTENTTVDIVADFIGNYAEGSSDALGGAIYNYYGTINSITGDFIGNYAEGSSDALGGAIYNYYGTINSITGDFIGNHAGGDGGAIYKFDGTINSITGDFIGNHAGRYGGAIFNYSGDISSINTINSITGDFIGNHAGGDGDAEGGAIHNFHATINSIEGDFIGNYVEGSSGASVAGGAIYNYKATINSITGDFIGNHAGGDGGAIYSYKATINSITGDFIGNYAKQGGAVYNEADGITTINSITGDFIGNHASSDGGAICNWLNGTINSITGDFIGNYSNYRGGAIFNYEGTINSIESNFIGNHAGGDGGAIYNKEGTINSIESNFIGNHAGGDGGAIYNNSGATVNFAGTNTFSNNAIKNGATTTPNDIYNAGTLNINGGTTSFNSGVVQDGGRTVINNNNTILNVKNGIFNNSNRTGDGGAIYISNAKSTLSFSGANSFSGNHTQSTSGYARGAAIFNNSNATIKNSGTLNFTNNYVQFNGNSAAQGGAIWNGGIIENLTGSFSENYANSTGQQAQGGALVNFDKNIGTLNADFTKNYATSTSTNVKNGAQGGAIWNYNADINSLSGTFTGNYVKATNLAQGGAIYNAGAGIINLNGATFEWNGYDDYDSIAVGDIKATNAVTKEGGAIYNATTINFAGTNTFSNNAIKNGATTTPNDIYNAGTLNINGGITSMDGGILGTGSTIVGNGTDDVALNLVYNSKNADLQQTNLTVKNNATLTVNADKLIITNDISNAGKITLTDGTLTQDITGEGTTIIDGIVNNTVSIANDITVNSGKTLISDISNLSGTVTNNGTFKMSGNLSKDIAGFGTTILQSISATVANEKTLAGTLDMNGKTVAMQDSSDVYQTLNVANLTGGGNLSIDVDVTNNDGKATASDKINITSGTSNSGTLNLSSINVIGTTCNYTEGTYNNFIDYIIGNVSGITYQLMGSTATYDYGKIKQSGEQAGRLFQFSLGDAGSLNMIVSNANMTLSEFISDPTWGATVNTYSINSDYSQTGNIGTTVARSDSSTTLNINLNNGSDITATGNHEYNGITVASGHTLNLTGSTKDEHQSTISNFSNALTTNNDATINVTNLTFKDNVATNNGGAIYNQGTLTVVDSEFTENSAHYGGAIYNKGSINSLVGKFTNNKAISISSTSSALSEGGALYNEAESEEVVIIGNLVGDFEENSATAKSDKDATVNGGTIYNANATIVGITGNFVKNTATVNAKDNAMIFGGVLYNSDATIGNMSAEFVENKATVTSEDSAYVDGGVIYNDSIVGDITGKFLKNETTIEGIHGRLYGGAINNYKTIGEITSNFVKNKINVDTSTTVTVEDESAVIVAYSYVDGGLIYNDNYAEKIGDITGSFIKNEIALSSAVKVTNTGVVLAAQPISNVAGGSIANFSTVGDIAGNFIGNKVTSNLIITIEGKLKEGIESDAIVTGGSIANYGEIKNITGNFIRNNASSNSEGILTGKTTDFILLTSIVSGGAIYNNGTIESVIGDFRKNTATATSSAESEGIQDKANVSGGAIQNEGTIAKITGSFEENSISAIGAIETGANGAAISNENGEIEIIGNSTNKAIFTQNTATASGEGDANANGGAIYNNGSEKSTASIGDITGDFVSNSLKANSNEANSYARGGAIYNSANEKDAIAQICDIIGTFEENSISAEGKTEAYALGGAIYNNSVSSGIASLGNITATFVGNSVSAEGKTEAYALGGAIYNENGLIGEIDGSFIGNSAIAVGAEGKTFAQGGAIRTNTDLKFVADGKTNVFAGNKTIANGVEDDNAIYVANIDVPNSAKNATLTFETKNGGRFDFRDNIRGDEGYVVKLIGDGTGTFGMYNNMYGANLVVDGITIDTVDNIMHDYNFESLTINSDINKFVDADLANKKMDTFNANSVKGDGNIHVAGINIQADMQNEYTVINFTNTPNLMGKVDYTADNQQIIAPIFRYNVDYDSSTGNFAFTRASVNPVVNAGGVAQQAVYLQQLTNYDQMFLNADLLGNAEVREAMKMQNRYASNDAVVYSPINTNQDETRGLWVRPYASYERVELENGPGVDNTMYGSLLGGDTGLISHDNGWDTMYSAFAGYNGSHQAYQGISIYQNGGVLGGTAAFYKGNFFTMVGADVGLYVADVSGGSDNLLTLTAGVASKTGYNWNIFNGKMTVQPNFMLSYTFANTFDYNVTSMGKNLGMRSDVLNAIQIAPELKLIGNLKNGWQPYASFRMVWNIMDKAQFYAQDIALPQLSVKPFCQYGVGVQKKWADRFTVFGEIMMRSGGRNGVGGNFGFRWTF